MLFSYLLATCLSRESKLFEIVPNFHFDVCAVKLPCHVHIYLIYEVVSLTLPSDEV